MGCSVCNKQKSAQSVNTLKQSNLCNSKRVILRQVKRDVDKLRMFESDSELRKEYKSISLSIQTKLLNKFYCPTDEEYLEIIELKNRIGDELTKFGFQKQHS